MAGAAVVGGVALDAVPVLLQWPVPLLGAAIVMAAPGAVVDVRPCPQQLNQRAAPAAGVVLVVALVVSDAPAVAVHGVVAVIAVLAVRLVMGLRLPVLPWCGSMLWPVLPPAL